MHRPRRAPGGFLPRNLHDTELRLFLHFHDQRTGKQRLVRRLNFGRGLILRGCGLLDRLLVVRGIRRRAEDQQA